MQEPATLRPRFNPTLSDGNTSKLSHIKSEQLANSYRSLNPAMLLPTLIDGNSPPLIQSLAILEYLEEQYPEPPLLPEARPVLAPMFAHWPTLSPSMRTLLLLLAFAAISNGSFIWMRRRERNGSSIC